MKKIFYTIILLSININSFSQYDSLLTFCNNYIKYPFISDGQQYRVLLTKKETAEFKMTFYGKTTYRIIIAGTSNNKKTTFRLYDKYQNELFSNKNHNNAIYWDFIFDSTVECYIEAELADNIKSGLILMFIAFKQK